MPEKRKDNKGRNLRTGEYYDEKNKRYMFRKMVNGERGTITSPDLADLRRQENELLCRIDKGSKPKSGSSKVLLNEYFECWMETYAKTGRKATTCTNYKSYYNTYINNTIGKKKITKITKADCQKIINEMTESGKKHSTMSNLKSCLNNIFECAVDDEMILKNPAKNIQIPRTERKKREAIEQNQIELFMRYVKTNGRYQYAYPAFVALFNLGVRIGEMAALTWDDIDFENNIVEINKTVNRYRKADYGFTLGVASPKNKASCRCIPMNNTLKRTFLKLKMQHISYDMQLPYVDDSGHIRGHVQGFLFYNSYGRVWSEPAFRDLILRIIDHYNKEAEKNGTEKIKNFCPHSTRHSFTSLAYEAGVDMKSTSSILGHASTAVTLDTYTHLTEEQKKKREAAIQKIRIS